MEYWKTGFRKSKFRTEFIITILVLIVTLHLLSRFLVFVEAREGAVLADPLLPLFNAVDLTWLIFGLIYFSLVAAVIIFIQVPQQIMLAIQSYIVMVVIRIMAMYLTPLDPPPGMIPLNDPVVEVFGTGQLLTRDLFFSGHTATLFLFYLVTERKLFKSLFLVCSILVALSVLLQKVHYTIDVLAAPFFAYGSFIIVTRIRNKFAGTISSQ
jgi:membrane-associated phospholipid phosphatase